jgi:hypothetical protein
MLVKKRMKCKMHCLLQQLVGVSVSLHLFWLNPSKMIIK